MYGIGCRERIQGNVIMAVNGWQVAIGNRDTVKRNYRQNRKLSIYLVTMAIQFSIWTAVLESLLIFFNHSIE